MEIKDATRESLQKDNAPLFAALQSEFMASGAKQELERQAGVRATLVPGHEALVETLANDGKTTPAEAALQVNAAVRAAHKGAADAHLRDGPAPAQGSASPDDKVLTRDEQWAKCQAYMAAHKVDDVLVAMKALGFNS